MNNAISPHTLLSKLESQKRNQLLTDLAILTTERNRLLAELEVAALRYADIEKRHDKPCQQRIKASELAALEATRQEEASRKNTMAKQLAVLIEEEKELKGKIFASMSKSKTYEKLRKKEKSIQKRLSSHADQQAVDDLLARRCIQER